jgi:hypothetical protein
MLINAIIPKNKQMKNKYYLIILMVISCVVAITCCSNPKQNGIVTSANFIPPSFPQSREEKIHLLMQKYGWMGVVKEDREVFIVGEKHSMHNEAVDICVSLSNLYKNDGYQVSFYTEGLHIGDSMTFTYPDGGEVVFKGIERHSRGEVDSAYVDKVYLEYDNLIPLFNSQNYNLKYLPAPAEMNSFQELCVRNFIDTGLVKGYYRRIIKPVNEDIVNIIKTKKDRQIIFILCGNNHAQGIQGLNIGVNVIKTFWSAEEDSGFFLLRKIHQYLGQS